jgi:hypothetical protein
MVVLYRLSSSAVLAWLSCPSCPILALLPALMSLISGSDCPVYLSCPDCPVLAVMSLLSCSGRSVLSVCPVLPVQADFRFPVLTILPRLVSPGFSTTVVQSRLSCLSCHFLAVLSSLPCTDRPDRHPVRSVVSWGDMAVPPPLYYTAENFSKIVNISANLKPISKYFLCFIRAPGGVVDMRKPSTKKLLTLSLQLCCWNNRGPRETKLGLQ